MACNCCRSIDLNRLINGERIAHHPTFTELHVCSSAGDCRVCVWMASGLEKRFNDEEIRPEVYNTAEVYCCLGVAGVVETCGISEVFFCADIGHLPRFTFSARVDIFVSQGNSLVLIGLIN
jgi:hypothetical protein